MVLRAADSLGVFALEDVDMVEVQEDGLKVYFKDDSSKVYKGAVIQCVLDM